MVPNNTTTCSDFGKRFLKKYCREDKARDDLKTHSDALLKEKKSYDKSKVNARGAVLLDDRRDQSVKNVSVKNIF